MSETGKEEAQHPPWKELSMAYLTFGEVAFALRRCKDAVGWKYDLLVETEGRSDSGTVKTPLPFLLQQDDYT